MAEKKKTTTAKKAAPAKAPAVKAAAKVATKKVVAKEATKKVVAKKEPVAKTVAVKSTAPKAAVKKAVVAKVPTTKAPEKTVAKKAVASKAPAAKKVVTKVGSSKGNAADHHSFNPEYLVLMQKDPNWMQAFWDVNEKRVEQAVKSGRKLVLRLFDVASDLTLRKRRTRQFRDFSVPADARSWYIQNTSSNTAISVSLGSTDEHGEFIAFVESSPVQVFGSEGQFISPEGMFVRASLGGTGVGGFGSSQLGMSSQMSFPWTSSLAGSSAAPSSWGSSVSGESWNVSPAWAQQKDKDFFLWVKTRLIVYGGTRPDAHLQVRGEHFPLNPDGTFSFEQDLPDSTQIIPVFATDKDGDFPTTIVPIVIKRTE